jgi:hypothetical protein
MLEAKVIVAKRPLMDTPAQTIGPIGFWRLPMPYVASVLAPPGTIEYSYVGKRVALEFL